MCEKKEPDTGRREPKNSPPRWSLPLGLPGGSLKTRLRAGGRACVLEVSTDSPRRRCPPRCFTWNASATRRAEEIGSRRLVFFFLPFNEPQKTDTGRRKKEGSRAIASEAAAAGTNLTGRTQSSGQLLRLILRLILDLDWIVFLDRFFRFLSDCDLGSAFQYAL